LGYILGDFFSQTHPVTLLARLDTHLACHVCEEQMYQLDAARLAAKNGLNKLIP
jgi:hypothetical protein